MNATDIEEGKELLRRCILDFSGIENEDGVLCIEYELARENEILRKAVATVRQFDKLVKRGAAETARAAYEKARSCLDSEKLGNLERAEDLLFDTGWDYLRMFLKFPSASPKTAVRQISKLNRPAQNGGKKRPRIAREHTDPPVKFFGYASQKNLRHVELLSRHPATATLRPFVLVRVDIDRDIGEVEKSLKRIIGYLRRRFDNAAADTGQPRRFDKPGKRPAGILTDVEDFGRSVNAMRLFAGAEKLGLRVNELGDLMMEIGFGKNGKTRKETGESYAVQSAQKARKRFLKLFHHRFGEDASPFTIHNPVRSLGLPKRLCAAQS